MSEFKSWFDDIKGLKTAIIFHHYKGCYSPHYVILKSNDTFSLRWLKVMATRLYNKNFPNHNGYLYIYIDGISVACKNVKRKGWMKLIEENE